MAVTNLISTGAGALWNQWTPSGSTYSCAGQSSLKQSFAFQAPATYLSATASITQVVLNVTWATAVAGGALTICGVFPDFSLTNTVTNINPVAGAMTSTVTLTAPSGGWTIANLGTLEIQLLENGSTTTGLLSAVVGSGIYLAVTDTSVVPPGTESESILLIL